MVFCSIYCVVVRKCRKMQFWKNTNTEKRVLAFVAFFSELTSFWKRSRTKIFLAVGWKNTKASHNRPIKKLIRIFVQDITAMMVQYQPCSVIWVTRDHIKLFEFFLFYALQKISIHSCHHTAKIPSSVAAVSLNIIFFVIFLYLWFCSLYIQHIIVERKIWQRIPIKYVGISSLSKQNRRKETH